MTELHTREGNSHIFFTFRRMISDLLNHTLRAFLCCLIGLSTLLLMDFVSKGYQTQTRINIYQLHLKRNWLSSSSSHWTIPINWLSFATISVVFIFVKLIKASSCFSFVFFIISQRALLASNCSRCSCIRCRIWQRTPSRIKRGHITIWKENSKRYLKFNNLSENVGWITT